jgi:hypothetical protein
MLDSQSELFFMIAFFAVVGVVLVHIALWVIVRLHESIESRRRLRKRTRIWRRQ